MSVVVGILLSAVCWMACVTEHVQLGATATLSCNISYLHHTTWLKHSPGGTPAVVACAGLREGQLSQEFQLSPRFSVALLNRSLGLRIYAVEEGDLGLYYCAAVVNSHLTIGRGTVLQLLSPQPTWFVFYNWYSVAVAFVMLIMILTICITHWKVKSTHSKKTMPRNVNITSQVHREGT